MSADTVMIGSLMNCSEYQKLYQDYSATPLAREIWDTPLFEAWQIHHQQCKSCSDWTLVQRCLAKGIDVSDFPCVHMAYEFSRTCEQHARKDDCPEKVVIYESRFDEYSIGPRGGGGDFVLISHCPFCGTALPQSKRDRYFDELEELGLDVDDETLPEKYRDSSWWNR